MGLLKVSEQYDSQPILPLEVLALQAPFPGGDPEFGQHAAEQDSGSVDFTLRLGREDVLT